MYKIDRNEMIRLQICTISSNRSSSMRACLVLGPAAHVHRARLTKSLTKAPNRSKRARTCFGLATRMMKNHVAALIVVNPMAAHESIGMLKLVMCKIRTGISRAVNAIARSDHADDVSIM